MLERVQALLEEVKVQFNDYRFDIFDVKVDSLEENQLTLSGRVLDQKTRQVLLEKLQERFPELQIDDQSLAVLRKETPHYVTVGTNLTGLYSKPTFSCDLLSELLFGWPLEVLEENGKWLYVRQTDGYMGWAYKGYMNEQTAPAPTHLVSAVVSLVRESPDNNARLLTRLLSGTSVQVLETKGDYALVIANKGGWVPLADLRVIKDLPQTTAERRELMMADAVRMIGVQYLWGGCTGHGIDCSGLAQLLYRWVGITLPRDAGMQYNVGRPVELPFLPGDLMYFGEGTDKITHVGICMGGWNVIHSSRGRNGVYIDNVQEAEYLNKIYVATCRYME